MAYKPGFIQQFLQNSGAGCYPAEYNPKVHGPYSPGRFYGKDGSWKDVKIADMGKWLARRSYHPVSIGRGIGRAYHRYFIKWHYARTPAIAPTMQFCALIIGYFFLDTWSHRYKHCAVKYHW